MARYRCLMSLKLHRSPSFTKASQLTGHMVYSPVGGWRLGYVRYIFRHVICMRGKFEPTHYKLMLQICPRHIMLKCGWIYLRYFYLAFVVFKGFPKLQLETWLNVKVVKPATYVTCCQLEHLTVRVWVRVCG